MKSITGTLLLIVHAITLLGLQFNPHAFANSPCEKLGWFPKDFSLKDHTIFWYKGYYYMVATYLPGEDRFVYGRSIDLCQWETLSPILNSNSLSAWKGDFVWAPSVYTEAGNYYLTFTGVTKDFTQRILFATSTNPADPNSWQLQQLSFQPNHSGMVWKGGEWADCRDPNLSKFGNFYYLYYTGLDKKGGIIGLASATSPLGPWTDWGNVLEIPGGMPESSTLIRFGTAYYIFYNLSGQGEYYRIGMSPLGPWTSPEPFIPGWAHEIWQNTSGYWSTSYLTNYSVTISTLKWDFSSSPPRPLIIETNLYHQVLPLILRSIIPYQ